MFKLLYRGRKKHFMKISGLNEYNVAYTGKKSYKILSDSYKKEHNTAMSRLHNIKYLKHEKEFTQSFDDVVRNFDGEGFVSEFKSIGRYIGSTTKMLKEKVLSLYYSNKSRVKES